MKVGDTMTEHKFSIRTLWFMLKNVFKSSPILFPLLIIIVTTSISIGAFLLYVIKDLTNEVVLLIDGLGSFSYAVYLLIIYLVLELFVKLLLDWAREFTELHYFKQSEAYFSKIVLYKLGNLGQENMYSKDVYEKFQFTYQNNYMFYDLPWMLIRFLLDFGYHKFLYLGIVFTFNVYLGLYCLFLFIVNLLLSALVSNRIGAIHKQMVKPRRILNYNKDMLTDKKHVKETKMNRLERFFYERVENQQYVIRDSYYKVYRLNELINQIIIFVNYLFRIGLTILLMYMVYLRQINVGEALLIQMAGLALVNSSFQFKQPISEIVKFVSYAPTMMSLMFPVTKEEMNDINQTQYEPFTLPYGEFKHIKLHNVTYSYPSREDNQVTDVNLDIAKGEIISILGYNGSGKTTTTKLLASVLEPTSGQVLFNDHDTKHLQKEDIYKYFGIGFQDFGKYGLTLKENITIGRVEHASDEELFEAIKKANLQSIIDKFPDGLQTFLGKEFRRSGQEISGGEWQRIILSRAYIGQPEILILDEPTASIDPFEEERMLDEFHQILQGKTAILISHRISFARLADKIVIMKDGRIVEQGSHQELLDIQGYYHELFTSQKELYTGGEDHE